MNNLNNNLPIGVFDSGMGGLTVLKALQAALPHESFLYLGDTARLPYGTKSQSTVQAYSVQTTNILAKRGIKMLVVACNTASGLALDTLQKHCPDIPVIGVIEPGSRAACETSDNGHIVVIATESTIHHQAYDKAIKRLRSNAHVYSQSCSLLVPLVEEGWHHGEIAIAIVKRYLQPLLIADGGVKPDCLVLGCTHFPALFDVIRDVLPSDITIVDSATTTTLQVVEILKEKGLLSDNDEASAHFLVTDQPERFIRVAHQFLENTLSINNVELVDLIPNTD